jgi:hypothetical protein
MKGMKAAEQIDRSTLDNLRKILFIWTAAYPTSISKKSQSILQALHRIAWKVFIGCSVWD